MKIRSILFGLAILCVSSLSAQVVLNYTSCEGDTVRIGTHKYTTSQSDVLHYLDSEGMDSIVKININFLPAYHFVENRLIADGEAVEWRGKTYRPSSDITYYDYLKTVTGCDSVYSLNVRINRDADIEQRLVNICDGESYATDLKVLTKSGVYRDTLMDRYGRDSIIEYIVNVFKPFNRYDTVYLPVEEQPYTWQGKQITESGSYKVAYTSVHGCDSTYHLFITFEPSYIIRSNAAVCENDLPYTWRGHNYYQTGIYSLPFYTESHLDSVYQLNLTVYPVKTTRENYDLCEGNSITLHGKTYSEAGLYRDTVSSRDGCDSIIEISILIHTPYEGQETAWLESDQGSYTWPRDGQTYDHEGVYKFTKQSQEFCDSVWYLYLKRKKSYLYKEEAEVCCTKTKDYFTWRGRDLRESGIYCDSYRTTAGADSVYQLTLTIHPYHEEVQDYYICEGDSIIIGGEVFRDSRTWSQTLQSIYGCDSVVTIRVHKHEKFEGFETAYLSDDSTYVWKRNGQTYNHVGTFVYENKTTQGCDSIWYLTLISKPSYHFIERDTLCQTPAVQSYSWRGQVLTKTGSYFDTYKTTLGQDSIYELKLEVHPYYVMEQNLDFCDGDSVVVRNKVYKDSGIYIDSLQTHFGCDSVIIIRIHKHDHFTGYDTGKLDKDGSYTWTRNGQTYTKPGTYIQHYQTAHGCDSVYYLYLTQLKDYYFIENEEFCQSKELLYYEWRGQKITTSGTYYDKLQTVDYQDSIYQLNINVHPYYEQEININLCEGDSTVFRGIVYNTQGDYTDSLKSQFGCDSVLYIHVHVHPIFEQYQEDVLSDGGSYTWPVNGETYTTAGNYEFRTKSANGCDSIWHLYLRRLKTYHFIDHDDFCRTRDNNYYVWRGRNIGLSGTYWDSLHTVEGQDSIYELQLNVYPYYEYTQRIKVCQGGSIIFGGRTYTEGGVYTDSLHTAHGCDSIITTIVEVDQSFHHYDTIRISNQEHVDWHGQTLNQSGNYFDYHTSVITGCDSVYQLHLIVCPTYIFTTDAEICQSETPYIWRGHEYDRLGSNTYEEKYYTTAGYDSIYRLNLTVYETYEFHQTIQLCPGESQVFRGKTYSEAGDYNDTLRSSNGCDSICHVHVIILKGYHNEEHVTLNDGESYVWSKNGQTYTEAGTYEIKDKTIEGCDSTSILFITRNKKYFFQEKANICELDTTPYHIWHGIAINETGTYWDSLQTVEGQDSVYRLDAVILPRSITYLTKDICQSETFTWGKQTITESGVYYDTIASTTGCDSILVLSINFTKFEVQQYDTICDGDTIMWEDLEVSDEKTYQKRYPRENGCDSILKLQVTLLYPFTHDYSDTICEAKLLAGEPYLWGPNKRAMWGKWNDASGHFEDSTYVSCDSTHYFHLRVLPERIHVDTITICQGDSVEVILNDGKHQWLKEPGRYYDTIPAAGKDETYACDSIECRLVRVHSTSLDTLTQHIEDNQLPYTWRGQKIIQTGYYRDTLQTAFGCDSIEVMHIIVDTTYFIRDSIHICHPHYHGPNDPLNTPYIWEGHKQNGKNNYEIYEAGTYWDSLKTINSHVDSVYCLVVTTMPIYYKEEIIDLCDGDSIQFGGLWLRDKGVYKDTMRTAEGCDSIVQLTINKIPSYFMPKTVNISDKQTYNWVRTDVNGTKETVLSVPGIYRDTLQTARGCDSIVELTLNVHPTYFFKDSVSVCKQDLPFIWTDHHDNRRIYDDGTYYDSLQTIAGYDSIYVLTLTILPSPKTKLFFSTCAGDSIRFNNKVYTQPGMYQDTLPTAEGCDSVFIIQYEWRDRYYITKTAVTDDKHPYIWTEGTITRNLTVSGTYVDTLQAVTGCDSIIELTLTIYPTYLIKDSARICEQDLPFVWTGHLGNKPIHSEGIYYDTLRTVAGYDSIFSIKLTILPSYRVQQSFSICAGDSLQYNGHTYKEPGIFRDTLLTKDGCDSIVETQVRWNNTYFIHKDARTDDKHPYVWTEGKITKSLTISGTYWDSLQTITGCDSIIELTLTVYPTYLIKDSARVCEQDLPFIWTGHLGNKPIYTNGIYYDTLRTVAGYDSVCSIKLTILPSYRVQQSFSVCAGDSIQYNGHTYKEPGIFRDTLLSKDGCDSIVETQLRWNDTYFIHKDARTDDKHPYVWTEGGITKTFTASGTYRDTLQTIAGCDSIIELTLRVYKTYQYEENQAICASETPYEWRGNQYWTSGRYTDSLQTVANYDSLYVLNLTVHDTTITNKFFTICRGESFEFNGQRYSHGGVWTDTLTNQYGCDSIILIRVRQLPDYLFSDTVAVSNRQPYPWRGKILRHTGIYRDSLTASTGCDSIYQLVLTIYDKEIFKDTVLMACQNDLPIKWREKWLSQSSLFYDTISSGDVDTIWQVDMRVIAMEYESIERNLCVGESYTFNHKTFTRDTLIHDTLYAGYGCGKEYTLYLHFREPRTMYKEGQTSNKKPYIWQVEDTTYVLSYSGDYEHIVPTKDGQCDSLIYKLHLTVGQVYLFKDSTILCQSELPYMWHNQTIYDAGIYYDSLQTVMGYDSVYMLNVQRIMPAYFSEQTINLCDGAGAFYYRGKPYSKQGVYYDTIPSVEGCDSVFRITVRVMPTYEIYDTINISDKETYNFNGRELYVPGPYVAYNKTSEGCDSILHLQLYMHPSYFFDQKEEICEKDTFKWHGRSIYTSGIYYDSLLTTQGYDSVYKLTLTVNKTYFYEESLLICPDRTTYLHGMNISEPGIYYDTLYSVHGCDSVYKITVNLTRSFVQEYTEEICQGESYDFYGVKYSRSGTYIYKIGCDSIITLHLIVHPISITEKRVVVAEEDLPYRYDGREFWETKIYVDSMTNQYGCDSLFKLNLIVSQHVSPWNQVPLCPGSEIKIDSLTITKSGQYTFLRRSKVSGLLDSIYRVEVYDAPAYDFPTETRTICQGDTTVYCGQKIWRTGHYDFSFKTVDGCDSLHHLDLIVAPKYQYYEDATIADYQTYLWRGREYTIEGEYDVTFLTVNGCDSTYTLRLTVIPTSRYNQEDSICTGDKYVWRGQTLYDEGWYNDTILVLGTHTSAIYSLHLVVAKPTKIASATISEACADDEYIQISFEFSGTEPTNYSILFDQLAKKQGFTDVLNEPLNGVFVAKAALPQRSNILYLDHPDYVRPDYYTLRLVFDNGVCPKAVSDSLSLLVRYPSWIIEQNWSNVVAPLKPELNGHYSFTQYDWYVNGTRQYDNGKGYLHSDDLKVGDEVVLYITRQGESYAIPTCPLIIQKPAPDVYTTPVLVYPTQVSRKMPVVTISSPSDGNYTLFSTTGSVVERGILEEGEKQVTLPSVCGIYIIHTITKDGQEASHKVQLY